MRAASGASRSTERGEDPGTNVVKGIIEEMSWG
jgi:hypothetical protein